MSMIPAYQNVHLMDGGNRHMESVFDFAGRENRRLNIELSQLQAFRSHFKQRWDNQFDQFENLGAIRLVGSLNLR